MSPMNKTQVDALFQREAILIGTQDVVPALRVESIFGKSAEEYARRSGFWNGYGVGDFTLDYITYQGFQAAASFYNVQSFREVAVEV